MHYFGKLFLGLLSLGILACCSDQVGAADINVLSREDGSGTRGAFVELFDIEEKINGKKIDLTTDKSEITNSTSVMMTSVSGDKNAIGYISLGSLNSSVKPVAIDGIIPSVENIKNGNYKISRPFNIVRGAKENPAVQQFLNFIFSKEGQGIIEKAGYISVGEAKPFSAKNLPAKIVVAGSSSVTPVMEKLKEAYLALSPESIIEIQLSDSTTGINAARDGICDIGMSSRPLKENELKAGLKPLVIAIDGIAVIVNKANPIESLSKAVVKDIYTGKITNWNDVMK